jgi:hypothetical protein
LFYRGHIIASPFPPIVPEASGPPGGEWKANQLSLLFECSQPGE